MPSSTPLLDLAAQISDAAKALNDYLVANELPQPSFSADGPLDFPSDAPPGIAEARVKLANASRTICDLSSGPSEYIRRLALHHHDSSTLRWIYRYNIAHIVPLDGEISYAELAEKAGVIEDHARRMLRFAMTNRLFTEPRAGYIAHTATSSLLVRSETISAWIGYATEEAYPSSFYAIEAMENLKNGSNSISTSTSSNDHKNGNQITSLHQRAAETPFNLAFKTNSSYFEFLAQHPEREKRFHMVMEETSSAHGFNTCHLVDGYPWEEELGNGTLVDVAGSTGHASIAIATKSAPNAKFIVQDLPQIVEQGQKSLPSSLTDRITFQTYDFFTPQPVRGADIYLLRFILHDHADENAISILRNLIPALKDGARIILNDAALPDPGVLPPMAERVVRQTDLEMLNMFNSRERSLEDWVELCSRADRRLKFGAVRQPPGSSLAIMEIVFYEKEMDVSNGKSNGKSNGHRE